jgi:hypothetical protein
MYRSLLLVLALSLGAGGCAFLSSDTSASNARSALSEQVNDAPPPDKAEGARPASPGFGYIWVAGYWDYLDGNFIWRDGRWVQGKPDYEYVRARYQYDNAGKTWVFYRPHWKRRAETAPAPKAQATR